MLLSNGFEEVEAAAPADLLIRGGVSVEMCSITGNSVLTGAHQMKYLADTVLPDDVTEQDAASLAAIYDGVILPGGQPNAGTLRDDERVGHIVRAFYEAEKITAAICAAPCVFEKAGMLKNRKATSYPECVDPASCGMYTQDRVVRDGTVITSRSAGTALDFGFEILCALGLADTAETIRSQILY